MREGEEEGAHRGAPGARGPSWAGLGRATSRIKTHDTHDYQTDSNREPKNRDGMR
jgi:hypothetical protein